MLGPDGAGPESHPISSPIVRPSNQTFRKGGGGGLSRFVSEVQDLGILRRLGLFRCGRWLGPAASVCPASVGYRAIHGRTRTPRTPGHHGECAWRHETGGRLRGARGNRLRPAIAEGGRRARPKPAAECVRGAARPEAAWSRGEPATGGSLWRPRLPAAGSGGGRVDPRWVGRVLETPCPAAPPSRRAVGEGQESDPAVLSHRSLESGLLPDWSPQSSGPTARIVWR